MLPKEAATKGKRIMTVRSTFALTVLAALGLAAAHPAAAQTVVFDVSPNPSLAAGGGTGDLYLGNTFTDSATEAVTYLGFFDNGSLLGTDTSGTSNTYYYNHYVQLRIDDITASSTVAIADVSAITSTGVDTFNIGFQSGSYYYVPATGTITGGSHTYVIATYQNAAYAGNFDPSAPPSILDTNVAFTSSYPGVFKLPAAGFTNYQKAGDPYLDGANFIVAAPEPAHTAALGLFGLGLGVLVLKARKGKASGVAV